eukprot:m.353983 g.353983  ORF g.353983 m.353983 type:complete len:477 (+) comp16890_c0_seq1:313-1743(+)
MDAASIDYSLTKERVCASVPAPETKVLDVDDVFDGEGLPRDEMLKEHFKNEGRVTPAVCLELLSRVEAVLRKEPNVLQVPAPVVIVGDIHGQFYDLMKVFQVGGHPHKTQYLFLGDYVDRGFFSLECVLYIWALKLRFPNNIWMLRGNHECRHLTEYFTYKTEVEYKSDGRVYDACMSCFDALPLAAIMNEQFFCVHGGISPDILTVDDILKIDRFTEPDEAGPMCDLLWSDPHESFDGDTGDSSFMHNETRGCSYVFTHKAVCDFLNRNKLLSVIRAHEAQDAGYRMYKPNPDTGFPSVITIFSAPNYLDVYNNKAAVMIYSNNSMNIKKFSHADHPYWLPSFLDVFSWSLPFIYEKTTEMLEKVMSVCTEEELAAHDPHMEEIVEKLRSAQQEVKTKRQSYSDIAEINRKSLIMGSAISPTGDNIIQEEDLAEKIKTFEGAKELDKQNEHIPGREGARQARRFRRRQTLEDIDS